MRKIINIITIILTVIVIVCSLLMYVLADGKTPAWQTAVWAFIALIEFYRAEGYKKWYEQQ